MITNKEQLAALTEEDWSKGVQLMVKADANLLGPNEHRNIESYPIIDSKVRDLKASIKSSQTTGDVESGLWWNQEFGVYSVPDIASIEFDENGWITSFPFTSPADNEFPLRQISGHHRKRACEELKFRYYAGTVRIIDRDTRFRMMANENFDTYSAHPLAQMETVKQGAELVHGYANEFDNWDQVNGAHPGVFKDQKAWKNCVSQGVGKKALTHFLGKPWTETSVAYLLRMIKNVERGVFTTQEVAKLPSISTANAIGTLLTTLQDKKAWPQYYKDKFAKSCLAAVTNPNSIATVKVISDAKDFMLNQNCDPAKYLATKTQVVFDLVSEIKRLIKKRMAEMPEGEVFDSSTLTAEGFEGYEADIMKAVKELKEGTGTATAPETAEGLTEEAEAAAAAAVAGVEVPEVPTDVAMDAVTEAPDAGEVGEVSVTATIKEFIDTAYSLEMLVGRLADMDIDYANEGNAPLVQAIMSSLTALHAYATDKLKDIQQS